ncbi:MAG: peptidase family protein [Enterovirga sp.]|nr:peptidase family protein [Enterovirga sp.]
MSTVRQRSAADVVDDGLRRPPARPGAPAAGRKTLPRKPASRAKGRGSTVVLVGCLLFAMWAVAATWFAISANLAASRMAEEQVDLRLTYDEKVKALTRRLVGVASHQILEQDGLSGRLADIISRQVELENRQSSLIMMTDRLNGVAHGGASSTTSPATVPLGPPRGRAEEEAPAGRGRPAAPAEPPTLKLGAPSSPAQSPASLGPRSSLDAGALSAASANRFVRQLLNAANLPLRDQFSALEGSIGHLENAQVRLLAAVSSGVHNAAGSIKTALVGLGLNPQVQEAAPPEATRKPGGLLRLAAVARQPAVDPFEAKLAAVERDFAFLQSWREVADTVPLRRPVEGDNNLTSNFGTRKDPFTGEGRNHAGIDFRGPIGTPIRASGTGRVITADVTGGYGNLVEVDHGSGIVSRYAHLSAFNVSVGQTVAPGTVVGLLGSTGRSTGPHLHYETRLNGAPQDPMRFLLAGAQLFNQPPPIDLSTQQDAGEDASFD